MTNDSAPSSIQAVVIRFVSGTFMGIPAVAQTYMADITDDTNMATAFSMFGMVRGREQQIGGSGDSLEPPWASFLNPPPGPLPTHLHTVYLAYSECLPTRLNPLAERTCFSQVRGCVLVVGPALGGFLVRPAERFGGIFDNALFRTYPFCLPILVGCCGLTASFIGVFLFLPGSNR